MAEHRVFTNAEEFEAFRLKVHEPYTWVFGDWEFNWLTRRAGGVSLMGREADVLCALCEALPNPLSGRELGRAVERLSGDTLNYETVRTWVLRLRKKIGEDRILTEGRMYYFQPFPEVK